MLSLSDRQLQTVMKAAAEIPQEKRSLFLERLGAMLTLRRRFSDADLDEMAKLARTGLAQQPEAGLV